MFISVHHQIFVVQLERIDSRLTKLESKVATLRHGMGLFYEKLSLPNVVKLLNDFYLIDIQSLDRRILSSSQSNEMHLFFQFVGSEMQKDYSHRWTSIQHFLHLSFHPKSIEFNLLGFGRFNQISKENQLKLIESPIKQSNTLQYPNRSSYATGECGRNKNIIVVFEATTGKLPLTNEILENIKNLNQKQMKPLKMLIRKLTQLERQIYFLSFYYSVGLHQFFCGLILLELYRDPSVNPNELLNQLMSSQIMCDYLPLLSRLYKLDQFLLTY